MPQPTSNSWHPHVIWATVLAGIVVVGLVIAAVSLFPRTVDGRAAVSADDDIAPIALRPVTTAAPATPPCPAPDDVAATDPMDTCSVDADTYYVLKPQVGTVKPTAITVGTTANGDNIVTITIDQASQQWFAGYTAAHISEQLALIRSGRVVTAPTINSTIDTPGIEVSGLDSADDAQRIADLLITGS